MLWQLLLLPAALAVPPTGPHVSFSSLEECTADPWSYPRRCSALLENQRKSATEGLSWQAEEYERVAAQFHHAEHRAQSASEGTCAWLCACMRVEGVLGQSVLHLMQLATACSTFTEQSPSLYR